MVPWCHRRAMCDGIGLHAVLFRPRGLYVVSHTVVTSTRYADRRANIFKKEIQKMLHQKSGAHRRCIFIIIIAPGWFRKTLFYRSV